MTRANVWWSTPAPLARWVAELPPLQEIGTESLLGYLSALVDEGLQRQVLAICTPDKKRLTGDEYVKYLRQRPGRPIAPPLAQWNAPPFQRYSNTPLHLRSRVTFHANGAIRTAWVPDMSLLREQLPGPRPGFAPARVPPLSLESDVLFWGKNDRWPLEISFCLYTDIWFPKTADWPRGLDVAPHIDNSPLTRLHSLRLNLFLESARLFTTMLGGVWYLDEPDLPWYADQCSEKGVIL